MMACTTLSSGVIRFGGYANRHWWWSRQWRNESMTPVKVWGRHWEVGCQIVFNFGLIEFERTIRHAHVLEGFKKPGQIKWWRVLLIFLYHYGKVIKILAFEGRQTWICTPGFLFNQHVILDNYPLWVLVFKASKYLLPWTVWEIKLDCVCEILLGVLGT